MFEVWKVRGVGGGGVANRHHFHKFKHWYVEDQRRKLSNNERAELHEE